MTYMYGGTILRVDLSDGRITRESTAAYSGAFLGGRGINARLLYDGVHPDVGPLDPANLLIFGVGPLCGTPVPASRTEVTTKSPETGFIGSSNFGGYFGPELKFAGYDSIAISGRADKPVYVMIENDRVEIRDASHVWGKDTYDTQGIIRSEVDPEARIACIGQAGENLVHFATVQHELGHAAGRTGMGAVMGSKNLKAIVVRGTKEITLANPERYLSIAGELQQKLRNHPCVQEKQKYGVSRAQNAMGAEWDPIAGQSCRTNPITGRKELVRPSDSVLKYKPERAGCFGCPTQCMDLYPVEAKGGGVISCVLYEVKHYVGSTDADLTLESSLLAQRYGVDVVSSMRIVGWLMQLYEKGVITARDTDGIPMEWGSREAIMGMFKKIVHREGFGNVLADGILPAAERIGRGAKDHAHNMKGLPMYQAATPESLISEKGSALAMVMSSRGDTMRSMEGRSGLADTFNALSFLRGPEVAAEYTEEQRQKLEEIAGTEKVFLHNEYEGKPELVAYYEDTIVINDCLSACKLSGSFLAYPFDEEYQAALFSAGTGVETSVDRLFEFAKRVRNLERAYCVREGMTRETDSLPKKLMDRPVESGPFKGEVLESAKFEKMKDEYYTLRGWDIDTGTPTRETLEQYGLGDVAEDLERRGKLPKKTAGKRAKQTSLS